MSKPINPNFHFRILFNYKIGGPNDTGFTTEKKMLKYPPITFNHQDMTNCNIKGPKTFVPWYTWFQICRKNEKTS